MRHATRSLSAAPLLSLSLAACSPPPAVQTVDAWLAGYAKGDVEAVVAQSVDTDRALVRAGLAELEQVPTGTLAMALPPRPLSHEILEIESKDDEAGRWVVLAKLTLKNPLPYMSERVGHVLPEMPKTREHKRRFLAVRTDEGWRVKLDLERVAERQVIALRLERAFARGALDEARAAIASLPPPPDDGNGTRRSDRLKETFEAELARREKARTATTTTATTSRGP